MLLALAAWEHSVGDRPKCAAAVLAAMVAFLMGLGIMAVDSINADPLDNCRESGSYQMVYIDDGWQCVPPDQEG